MSLQIIPLQALPFGLTVSNLIQILLSIGLVGLYLFMYKTQQRQADIQETQNEIMNQQTALMAANHMPDVTQGGGLTVDGDTLSVELSNRGNGPAKNLQIECVLYHQRRSDDSEEFEFAPANIGVGTVVGPVLTPLERTKHSQRERMEYEKEGLENTLEENEIGVWFESEIKLSPQAVGTGNYSAPFSEVMQRLNREWDVDEFAFELILIYSDVVNQMYALRLASYIDVPLENQNLQGAMQSGKEYDQIGGVIPEGVQEPAIVLEPSDFK
jgi:hypothetical protein